MTVGKRYRCRYCGTHLNAYLPWAWTRGSGMQKQEDLSWCETNFSQHGSANNIQSSGSDGP
jgi:hypothetical protein